MKHLIIYSHPNFGSFCHALLDTVQEVLEARKHEIVVRDLYGLDFSPVLTYADLTAIADGRTPADIAGEQEHIIWSDVMTFIYPVWWTGLPAMVKGYIDRVMSYGFAYRIGPAGVEKLLTGKKCVIFNTQGTPAELYEASGMFTAMRKTSDTGIFEFCGVEVLAHQFFGAVPYIDDAARKDYLAAVRQTMESVLDSLK